eukprot:1045332-Rhodomonas_salina.1
MSEMQNLISRTNDLRRKAREHVVERGGSGMLGREPPTTHNVSHTRHTNGGGHQRGRVCIPDARWCGLDLGETRQCQSTGAVSSEGARGR